MENAVGFSVYFWTTSETLFRNTNISFRKFSTWFCHKSIICSNGSVIERKSHSVRARWRAKERIEQDSHEKIFMLELLFEMNQIFLGFVLTSEADKQFSIPMRAFAASFRIHRDRIERKNIEGENFPSHTPIRHKKRHTQNKLGLDHCTRDSTITLTEKMSIRVSSKINNQSKVFIFDPCQPVSEWMSEPRGATREKTFIYLRFSSF